MSFDLNLSSRSMVYTDNRLELFSSLYSDSNGYIKLYGGLQDHCIYVPAGALCTDYADRYFDSNYIGEYNKKMSLGTFWTKEGATMENLKSINALAIEVGNLDEYTGWKKDAMAVLESSDIPEPSYIIEGFGLTLVYILDKPVFFANKKKGRNKNKTARWLNSVNKYLADKIEHSFGIMSNSKANPVKLAGFVRIPGNIEKIYDINFCDDADHNRRPISFLDRTTRIRLHGNGKKWDVQELSRQVLPARKEKKDYKITLTKLGHGFKPVAKRRCQTLEKIAPALFNADRSRIHDFFFLYFNELRQSGLTFSEAKEKVLAMSKNFFTPLTREEVLSACSEKIYKVRTATMVQKLKLDDFTFEMFCEGITDTGDYDIQYSREYRAMEKEEKIRNRETKRQKMEDAAKKLAGLIKSGFTIAKAAEALQVSLSTAKRYLALA